MALGRRDLVAGEMLSSALHQLSGQCLRHTWRHPDSCWTNESGALAGMGRGTDLGVKKRRVGGGWPQTGQGAGEGGACNEALRFRNKQSLSEEEAIPSSL